MHYRLKAGLLGLVIGLAILAGVGVFYQWQPWLSPYERCSRDLRRENPGASWADWNGCEHLDGYGWEPPP